MSAGQLSSHSANIQLLSPTQALARDHNSRSLLSFQAGGRQALYIVPKQDLETACGALTPSLLIMKTTGDRLFLTAE